MIGAAIGVGSVPTVGAPGLMFEGVYRSDVGHNPRLYDIAPDGEHFVMIRSEGESEPTEFRVVLNWFESSGVSFPPTDQSLTVKPIRIESEHSPRRLPM